MKILAVDDDPLVLRSLEMILKTEGIEEVYTAKNKSDTLKIYKNNKIDVVLQDIRMKEENGIDIAEEILRYDKNANIILLTTFKDEAYINKSIKTGVKGYILKDNIDSLVQSIKTVMAGNMVLDSAITGDIRIRNHEKKSAEEYNLTPREFELIELLAEGMNNKEISQKLFLSEGTVRNYISAILDKLDLSDRAQIVVFYYKHLA